jgi:hypothetical protein
MVGRTTRRLSRNNNPNGRTARERLAKKGQGTPPERSIFCALLIPQDVQKLGTALLHQQLWCWGYDIRWPAGNVLHRYGFSSQRPPDDVRGSTAYTLCRDDGRSIGLWGFGLLSVQTGAGSLFLQRYGFVPRLATFSDALPPAWAPEHLSMFRIPRTLEEGLLARSLLADALNWVSRYEQWVQENYGCDYRRECLAAWQQTVVPAEKVVDTWKHLSRDCATWMCAPRTQQDAEH